MFFPLFVLENVNFQLIWGKMMSKGGISQLQELSSEYWREGIRCLFERGVKHERTK